MASVGDISLDKNNIGDMVNNSMTVGEGVSQGLANESTGMGEIIAIAVIILLISFALAALFGIIYLILTKTTGIAKAIKM